MRSALALCVLAVSCAQLGATFELYPPLDSIAAFPDNATLATLDSHGAGNWSDRFHSLIASSVERHAHVARGDARPFEKLYCVGLQKSGTTSYNTAANTLGYKGEGSVGNKKQRISVRNVWAANKATHHSKLWYQNGELEPAAMESAVRTNLRVRNTFDDDPWFVLHRFADSVFNTSNVRVGWVLTLRNCRSLAESSAAYNNPRDGAVGNSDLWNHEHCSRHYRRCHVHLLDVYNFFRERALRRPLDDVLVIETASWRSQPNWHELVNFSLHGGNSKFGAPRTTPAPLRTRRSAILRQHESMPQANSRSSGNVRVFCPEHVMAPLGAMTASGALLKGLKPGPPNFNVCRQSPAMKGCAAIGNPPKIDPHGTRKSPQGPKTRRPD